VLYERALRRAQGGETSAALADLESLIRRHPSSPLIQNARVEHFRILVRSGQRSLAASEARRYLSDYPDGFARAEAKNVALLSGTGD
jgi:outer membrane protein assembly factor BamD (BamD/ComL family)